MASERRTEKGFGQLSNLRIQTAKPQAKPYRLPDGKGLFLWVTPAGGKSWRWKYRFDGAVISTVTRPASRLLRMTAQLVGFHCFW
ncbi:MAG: Arm DNA-binding domain-containing protein [Terracidiphilus sp.]